MVDNWTHFRHQQGFGIAYPSLHMTFKIGFEVRCLPQNIANYQEF
jgi:hypothetical protein